MVDIGLNLVLVFCSTSLRSQMIRIFDPETRARQNLCRLARFGANLSDAHSCFIFLPPKYAHLDTSELLTSSRRDEESNKFLIMGGYHSLSNDILEQCRVSRGVGLIGWVSKYSRSIHVSPFEHDSRTLGTYSTEQHLKSFIGIPIPLYNGSLEGESEAVGVLCCDSKKSFAFSKLHGKLLEDLAAEVSNTLSLLLSSTAKEIGEQSWDSFVKRGSELAQSVGPSSVEMLRVRLQNFEAIELRLGTRRTLELVERIYILIHQALPPNFPTFRLPNGDTLIVLDNMMTSFYETKLVTICDRIAPADEKPIFDFARSSMKGKRGGKGFSFDEVARDTIQFKAFPKESLTYLERARA